MDQVAAILSGGGESAPTASADAKDSKAAGPKKPAGPLKPMSIDPKPFVVPEGLDFSGPKQNPVPTIPRGLKPAVLPQNWPGVNL